MSDKLILVEHIIPKVANIITESTSDGKDFFLSGIFMQAEVKNGNGRNYPRHEIERAVDFVNQRLAEGHYIPGELNHPDSLQIDLERVSHIIVEMKMVGNNAVGKAKILPTPMGNIVKGLLEGGFKPGVSSRGAGTVMEGSVSDFTFITEDIVATPSAPDAYPTLIRESLEMFSKEKELLKLSEAIVHDRAAQKYFEKEIISFISFLTKK